MTALLTTPPTAATRRSHRGTWLAFAVALVGFAVVEVARHDLGPWPILAFIMSPDLSFLAGIGAPVAKGQLARRAVPFYNLVHRPALPLVLITAAAFELVGPFWFVGGVSWLAHIALDRAAGYRLRTKDGWQRD
ncbi:MAG TPA: DUF4260 family protein [Ilumatobacteraceae bacterium]|nr:DUF4260 family protein [Ilumatobacteraceae bacterium]